MSCSVRDFVQADERCWFRGRLPETNESLDAAEAALRIRVPDCIRWLLREFGYWHATGIGSLDESVKTTVAAREHAGLPDRYFVLYDHQDAGVVLIDTELDVDEVGPPIYHLGWEDIPERIAKGTSFPDFLAYVRDVLANERDLIDEGDIDYDPSRYPT